MVRRADCRGCRRSDLGICIEPAWNLLVDKDFQSGSYTLAGFLCADADAACPVPFGSEEMGLLDCLAGRECRLHYPLLERWPGIHADSERSVPNKRTLVALDLVQAI